MHPSMQQYMKAKYGDLPTVEVSREEFIGLIMAGWKSREDAELQANLCLALGSTCMVGEKLVGIKKED